MCLTVEQTLDEHTILNAAPGMHVGLQIQLLVVLFSTPLSISPNASTTRSSPVLKEAELIVFYDFCLHWGKMCLSPLVPLT